MTSDPFAGVLDPFAYWDIAATYDRYSAFFDLAIYCMLFMALAHAVFTTRFSGRAGKAMATAFGLALGISLTLAEQQIGWNLRQAGPFALLIVLLLLGFLILHVLLRVHVTWQIALPTTIVLMYLLLRAMSPALFTVLARKMPFINLLAAIIFLIALWRLGIALWPKGEGESHWRSNDASFIAGLNRGNEKRAMKVEKRIKGKLAPQVERETIRLENKLESVQKELRRSNPDWQAVGEAISAIAHRSDEIIQQVDQIRILDRRIRNFDWHELQELSGYCSELSDEDKERLKQVIQIQRNKIVQEHALNELCERVERRHGEFRRRLDEAGRACQFSDHDQTAVQVSDAITLEIQQKEDLQHLRKSQKKLLALTKTKLKRERS